MANGRLPRCPGDGRDGATLRARARARRRGNLVGIVLVVALGTMLLTSALMQRSLQSGRAARWGRDHLALQLLADSAAEELFVQVSKDANRPGEDSFGALRVVPRGVARPILVRGLSTPVAEASGKELARSLGSPIRISQRAEVRKLTPVGDDPLERCGILRIEVTAELTGLDRSSESVRVDHAFRVSRVTPPRPLDEVGMFVGMSTPAEFPMLHAPDSIYAALGHGPRTLTDLYTMGQPDGFQVMSRSNRPWMAKALRTLSPASLSARAHYMTTSAAALDALLSARLAPAAGPARPVSGLIHNLSLEPVHLAFPRFTGKCLLSFMGPVSVGDIVLADPARDCLTIVSADRIVVTGHTVEAVLVDVWNPDVGITFAQVATIRGGVLASRFPGRTGLPASDFASCRIAHSAAIDSGSASRVHRADRLGVRYVAAFSPHPISEEHVRNHGAWSAW